MNLPRGVSIRGHQESGAGGVIPGEVIGTNGFIASNEVAGGVGEAVVGNGYPLVVAVEQVEALGNQVKLETVT